MNSMFIEDTTIEGRRIEMEIKLQRIYAFMDTEGLEALVLKKHSNFSWITAGGKSHVTISQEEGVATLLITKKRLYAIMSVIEVPRMKEEELLEELGFEILSYLWIEDKTASIIEEIAGDLSKVGSDTPLDSVKMLSSKIDSLKFSLTGNEICRYQYLGDTLSTVLEQYIATIKPGMTEYEITGGLCQSLWKHNIEQIMFIVCSDERAYKYRHGIPSGKKLENHLYISVNGRYKGLITTVTRMVHFGKVDDNMLKLYDKAVEIECRTISATKVGMDDLCAYNVCRQTHADCGCSDMWELHAQGGPQGYSNRYYITTPTKHSIVLPNSAYCYNPVIQGAKTEDAFIATEDGPLFITKPITFPVIEKEINGCFFRRPGLLVID